MKQIVGWIAYPASTCVDSVLALGSVAHDRNDTIRSTGTPAYPDCSPDTVNAELGFPGALVHIKRQLRPIPQRHHPLIHSHHPQNVLLPAPSLSAALPATARLWPPTAARLRSPATTVHRLWRAPTRSPAALLRPATALLPTAVVSPTHSGKCRASAGMGR
jgi:hypothetical protein